MVKNMYVKIKEEILEAMKTKNIHKRDVLKMVITKARIDFKEQIPNDTPEVIPDDIIAKAIQREIKQLNQTKDALKGKESCSLYSETDYKIAVLSAYLPSQMTREEVEKAVSDILSKGEYANFGTRMKVVMSELKGKADNKLIKEVIETFN